MSVCTRVVNRKSVNWSSVFKIDDQLPLFITDDRKRPTTRRQNATVLRYQHHDCLSGSLTHAHKHAQPSHPGRGRSSFPAQSVTVTYGSEAQLYEIKECTIVHFVTADAMLIAYLPAHCMHQCRCKEQLCADGIGNSVEVWCCCMTGGRDEGCRMNWAVDFQPECHE